MFIWEPGDIKNTNLYRFMNKHNINNYNELVKRSINDIEWFWDAVVNDLNVEFFERYDKVLDLSGGYPWAKWFVGGKINIAHNCVDRHRNKNKTAIIWEGEDYTIKKLTYNELYTLTNKCARALMNTGIKRGDRIGIFMPLVPETVVISMACAKIGAIFIPIFSGFGAQAVANRLIDSGAKMLFTTNGALRKGKLIDILSVAMEGARVASIKKIVVVERFKNKIGENGIIASFNDFIKKEEKISPSVPLDSETPFMLIYTSGTTGKPKGSVHVHGGFLLKITEEVAYQTDMHEDDVLFWFTDFGWIMGPWEIVGGLCLGGTIFCYEGAPDYPSPDRLWDMIDRHKITIFGISPTAIRTIMGYGEEMVKKHNLSSLRILASTGEPWNEKAYMWYFENVGKGKLPVINLSGGTEVGACFLSPHPIAPLKPCTLQGPALGMDIDVFDEEGKGVREKIGELVCKKPWPGMTRGIWGDSERYINTYWSKWEGVWWHGDLASIDSNGFWYLHGRSDDTIKVAGKRVGPAEIESVIVTHPSVLESAAIGVPDELKGEVIVCFAVLSPGLKESREIKKEIAECIASAMGKSFVPKEIIFVNALPKTRNAKILRRIIKAKYLGLEIGDVSNVENLEVLENIPSRH